MNREGAQQRGEEQVKMSTTVKGALDAAAALGREAAALRRRAGAERRHAKRMGLDEPSEADARAKRAKALTKEKRAKEILAAVNRAVDGAGESIRFIRLKTHDNKDLTGGASEITTLRLGFLILSVPYLGEVGVSTKTGRLLQNHTNLNWKARAESTRRVKRALLVTSRKKIPVVYPVELGRILHQLEALNVETPDTKKEAESEA